MADEQATGGFAGVMANIKAWEATCKLLAQAGQTTAEMNAAAKQNMAAVKALGLSASGTLGRRMVEQTVRYDEFIVRAQVLGLTAGQAKTLVESDRRLIGCDSPYAAAEVRLDLYLANGYLNILLGEVLTEDELTKQAFGYGTILNAGRWMKRPYARHFAAMSRDQQRGLVLAAIELTAQLGGEPEGWPLERAMAAVMPYSE